MSNEIFVMRNFVKRNFRHAQFRKTQDIGLPVKGPARDGRDSRDVTSTEARSRNEGGIDRDSRDMVLGTETR